ncbi:MAG: tRNA ((37)-N1)-methyltransferase TrmD [Pseudomonadota bacterium]|jgi:tRNA (guanine37-N1)-methyltransferase
MRITLLTIFPELFESFLSTSLIAKAVERGTITFERVNIRDFASPPHYSVDDTPYGGGAGMVMKPEPLSKAIEAARRSNPGAPVLLLSPAGTPFSQSKALELSRLPGLILVCGRYEGVDERVIESAIDAEISIGDYVLMGGEIPAMVVIEATTRLVKDVIGNASSIEEESFAGGDGVPQLLEAPHYTRPLKFAGRAVPEVLLSGNHQKIAAWRREQSLTRTKARRPDLLLKESSKE